MWEQDSDKGYCHTQIIIDVIIATRPYESFIHLKYITHISVNY